MSACLLAEELVCHCAAGHAVERSGNGAPVRRASPSGGSTLHLAKLRFNFAYPACEHLPVDLSAEAQRRRKSEGRRRAGLPLDMLP